MFPGRPACFSERSRAVFGQRRLKVIGLMDILEQLGRTDRHEILGNRMTAYGTGLGGGSINYWDGLWANDPDMLVYQMLAVYEGIDGVLALRDRKGRPVAAQRYYHWWQPDVVRSHFVSHKRVVVKEEKGIWDDVFVSRLEFTNLVRRAVCLKLCREGPRPPDLRARVLPGGVLHLFSESGNLKGVHRLIGFGPFRARARVTRAGYSLELPVRLRPNSGRKPIPAQACFVVAMGMDFKDTLRRFRRALAAPRAALARRRQDWKKYFADCVPAFHCSDRLAEKFYYHSFYVAKGNLLDFVEGSFTRPYTCPSKMRLLPQWFWDLAFQAMHEKWTRGMPFPKSCMRNCLNAQKPDGHLIFIHAKPGDFLEQLGHGKLIQPFILPMAVWDQYLLDGDRAFLRECLPRLVAFDRWMQRERDPGREWLVHLKIPGESGWDNSNRFIKGKALTIEKCGARALSLQPVDFNTYVYLGRWLIGRMARELGEATLAGEYAGIVRKTAAALSGMWNQQTGMYADKFTGARRLSRIKSAGGLVPLLAGLASPAQARQVAGHMLNPREFWPEYPVPTLSMDDSQFTCDDSYQSYWNGRTWPNINWLILEGLLRARQTEAGLRLLEKMLALGVSLGEPYLTENYHPLKAYCYDINQNAICYGWAGIIADAMLRRAAGLQPNTPAREIILNPLLPARWSRVEVKNLALGENMLGLKIERRPGKKLKVQVERRGRGALSLRVGPERRLALANGRTAFEMTPWEAPHWLDL